MHINTKYKINQRTSTLSTLLLTEHLFLSLGWSRGGASRSSERLRRCRCEEILYLLPMGVLCVILPGKGSFISNLPRDR